MSARTAPDDGSGVNHEQAYMDAIRIESEAPGTVCVNKAHYVRDHRHEVPYRMGYTHHYRQPNEHYHSSVSELEGCEQ